MINRHSCLVHDIFIIVANVEVIIKSWVVFSSLLSLKTFDFNISLWALSNIIGDWIVWDWWSVLLEDVEALLDLRSVLDEFLIIFLHLLAVVSDWRVGELLGRICVSWDTIIQTMGH